MFAIYLILSYTLRFLEDNFEEDPEEKLADLKARKKKEQELEERGDEEFEIPDETPSSFPCGSQNQSHRPSLTAPSRNGKT